MTNKSETVKNQPLFLSAMGLVPVLAVMLQKWNWH